MISHDSLLCSMLLFSMPAHYGIKLCQDFVVMKLFWCLCWRGRQKESNDNYCTSSYQLAISQNWRSHAPWNWFACVSSQPLLVWIFWADSIFWHPWTIVHGPKGNYGHFKGKQKGAITPKPERPHPPKLVCMHVTSIPTCINFLSQFWSIKIFYDHGL